ncbi:MAG: signal peptidase I [Phocaeicola sp.]
MRNSLIQGIKALVAAVLLVLLTKAFAFVSCTIPSTGMENSLYKGERVLVSKWSYGLRMPFSTHRLQPHRAKRGDVALFNNPNPALPDTPIYLRELFISRCVGIPGDTLMLNKELLVTNQQISLPDKKALYQYSTLLEDTLQLALQAIGIPDNPLVGYSEGMHIRSLSHYEHYLLKQKLPFDFVLLLLYDSEAEESHPLVVPARGLSLEVYPWNATLLCNTIVRHEGEQAWVTNDTLFVAGKAVTHYTFTKDYYWMASNNPINLCDSRLFGLVPEDHLIGKAWLVWYTSRRERLFERVY